MADPTSPNLLPANFFTHFQTRKSLLFVYRFMYTSITFALLLLVCQFAFSSSSSSLLSLMKNPSFFSTNSSHFSYLFSHVDSNLSQISGNISKSNEPSKSSSIVESQEVEMFALPPISRDNEPFFDSNLTKSNLPSEFYSRVESGEGEIDVVFAPPPEVRKVVGGNLINAGKNDYEFMLSCNIYDGKWVKDDSYPLYAPGSCPFIDESFNCFLNGRPDNGYQKFRWQPNHCNIPRLNASHMLELLRGKHLVFVGDSLNRNMWESLVCILRNSLLDKSKVYEVSSKREFRSQGSYSFIFKDYNCSLEYFRSTFLVQAAEAPGRNGSKKPTLKLDLIDRTIDKYKNADILVFNTGHWWTRGRTSRGRDYYQEGDHVYSKLHVMEAYRRAIKTWAKWVDSSVDHANTQVFFSGYSSSHFRGGKWNSGGKCDQETEPFKNETYLLNYPQKMQILEDVMKSMNSPLFYLNITKLTDYRKDAHPAIYRAQHLSDEERHSPQKYQDCSHWCLPGVPDTWNELLYAQILIRQCQKQQKEQQYQEQHHG